ncbi:succinylglutamate desuccinylase/aspartoacylase family protein [Neorhizobium galegae]|uniref:succinylglutamate desuccinylase/aspartoacylase family protein n=1 Tax=Neorhizobium galegae TaxID=399 RepID=UPI000621C1A9|nr:succinylglutamate desuccinylase/aspartoacylase family protein [Neorhizobium galegae]CDZ64567.1 Ectoine utilization protein EutE [Neorhizobium galegae bv. orientalis]KAB1119974.1 succinylglutamate desuccinylase [Neorhizobium galegae]MCQ1575280.1 succinylglutamate desuccinylase/aspartoacylase family protein [Neorhizobium galegae]MCQ1808947.1 succinylglutamate desuccinylase/aspartoacylase family protein [Neorhizobium galegae]MCQ1838738.1 succinylglutamate desuccinylase/aspartoacylase family pr
MTRIQSRIWTPIDFEQDGKFSDCLRLPLSTTKSAYGWIPIPIVSIKNGSGPTAVLIAGNHGDEYEGQLALMKIARELRPEDVRGRVIIIPSLNFPAVRAGLRVSPLDDGNLNRSFPGKALGTPTEMIAHYISDFMLPMADIAVDLHSGGFSLDYIQCALVRPGRTEDETDKLVELIHVFGAPVSFISSGDGGGGATTLNAVARELGVLCITTELGGGATLSKTGLRIAEDGVKRLLKHFGITPAIDVAESTGSELMEIPGRDFFLYADDDGIFEPSAEVGDQVEEGQYAGRLHSFDNPIQKPQELYFPRSGQVACRRYPSLTTRGDCLFNLMRPRAAN